MEDEFIKLFHEYKSCIEVGMSMDIQAFLFFLGHLNYSISTSILTPTQFESVAVRYKYDRTGGILPFQRMRGCE